jgi:nucleotidyltransferase/DNA polymerase involved in DNA repair
MEPAMHLHLWIPTVHADAHRDHCGLDRATAVAVADSARADAALLAVTEAAHRLGARIGMLASHARARCAGLVVRAADAALARRTQARIGALCEAVSSNVSGDAERWDLDVENGPLPPPPPGATGLADARSIARAIVRACRDDLGLDAWAGVGGTIGGARLAARLARAQGDPRAAAVLSPDAAARMDGLPLSWLPDLPAGAAARLRALGITAIGALRDLAPAELSACLGRSSVLAAAAAACEETPVLAGRGEPGPTRAQGVWCGTRGATPARAAVLLAAAGASLAADLAASGLACAELILHARWIDPCGRSRTHRVRHAVRAWTELSSLAPTLARIDGVPVRWERFDLVAAGLSARVAAADAAVEEAALEAALAAVA